MRLYIGVLRPKKFFRALDGQVFGDIDLLAAPVVAFSRIAFRVLIGQHTALRFKHGFRNHIFGGDELKRKGLAPGLAQNGFINLRILFL